MTNDDYNIYMLLKMAPVVGVKRAMETIHMINTPVSVNARNQRRYTLEKRLKSRCADDQ